jgi:alpha-beta hydrolase superfamily lysophospholipase
MLDRCRIGAAIFRGEVWVQMRKRIAAAALGVAGVVGALAVREGMQRRADARRFEEGRDYWQLNFPPDYVRWAEDHLAEQRIPSSGIGINLDVYAQPDRAAPVVIIVHGLMTYGRLFLPLVRGFYGRGYTVICADLMGNGFSGGVRGDTPAGPAAAALVEVALWARQRYDGPLFMLGISLGSAVVYAAAAAGAPVAAIACLDLFTFDDHEALRQNTLTPQLINLLPLLRLLAIPFGWVRIPTRWINSMEYVVDPAEGHLVQTWFNDPLLPRGLTLRTLVSAGYTPPAVPPEQNTVPILVLNQECDRVLSPTVTREAYQRLGGPKRYVELAGSPHWSFAPAFTDRIVDESVAWFAAHNTATRAQQPAARRGQR